ncbi:hypothetical protein [Pseudomonas syringae]|uniref:hypothetical protein n=1 Tax=Pseudomonas syringae TaxID=317 RepID=UPI000736217C|nr:hypothetical protein [Pseudomonas syringae]KTB93680.1 hypothetical protein AO069_15930 [Pseudomonas syringae pv. syringae PD2774]MCH5555745.1 hypothetical protein [Pseudomonas syringae pv. syringae]MCH5576271.1 hypothetical protein [Pseudomonas syringae pv. syringae]MCH5668512.1 hypothetical protein [Pseudomonas syringae pv. syringae]MDF5774052.1 hypothetical protein [Pseudomonas syringae pv. syringae]
MSLIFREGVILSIAPVLAYVTAWMFEIGYAEFYGISFELIEVDLKAIIISMLVCLVTLLPFLAFTCLFLYLGVLKRSRKSRWWALHLTFVWFSSIILYISSFDSLIAWVGLALSLLLMAISFLRVAWMARSLGWDEAFSKAADGESIHNFEGPPPDSAAPTVRQTIMSVIALLGSVLIACLMIKGVGGRAAMIKTAFPTFVMDGKSYVVLAGYGDRFVLGGIVNGQFDENTLVIPKNSEKIINLKAVYYESLYNKK